MPLKDIEARRRFDRARHSTPEHKARRRALYAGCSRKSRKQGVKTWFYLYKETLSCVTCGESHSACLDFHHRDPSTKSFHVSHFNSITQSKELLQAEIAKCDVLCANCHRKLHYAAGKSVGLHI